MAAVSVVGLARSLLVGDLVLDPAAVGGADIAGMWLAAVPVVVIGAPVGSWVAARISGRRLAAGIAVLALVEVVSTVLFLDELRTDPSLVVFSLVAALATVWAVHRLLAVRSGLAAIRPAVPSVRRLDLEVTRLA